MELVRFWEVGNVDDLNMLNFLIRNGGYKKEGVLKAYSDGRTDTLEEMFSNISYKEISISYLGEEKINQPQQRVILTGRTTDEAIKAIIFISEMFNLGIDEDYSKTFVLEKSKNFSSYDYICGVGVSVKTVWNGRRW